MPTTLEEVLDAIAIHAMAATGLKRAYSAKAGTQVATSDYATIRPVPASIDDDPVLIILFGATENEPGIGSSITRYQIHGDLWVNASDGGYALKTSAPFVDRFFELFQSDLDANGTATYVLCTGSDAPVPEKANGRPYLVTRFNWIARIKRTRGATI